MPLWNFFFLAASPFCNFGTKGSSRFRSELVSNGISLNEALVSRQFPRNNSTTNSRELGDSKLQKKIMLGVAEALLSYKNRRHWIKYETTLNHSSKVKCVPYYHVRLYKSDIFSHLNIIIFWNCSTIFQSQFSETMVVDASHEKHILCYNWMNLQYSYRNKI